MAGFHLTSFCAVTSILAWHPEHRTTGGKAKGYGEQGDKQKQIFHVVLWLVDQEGCIFYMQQQEARLSATTVAARMAVKRKNISKKLRRILDLAIKKTIKLYEPYGSGYVAFQKRERVCCNDPLRRLFYSSKQDLKLSPQCDVDLEVVHAQYVASKLREHRSNKRV